ncbi:MAG: hypothetical protein EXR62_08520 [Chloroflexi bacterium]|nr:hypothetical protein [Chloroflexota bacterium]
MGVARQAVEVIGRRGRGRAGVNRRAARQRVGVKSINRGIHQAGRDAADVMGAGAEAVLYVGDQRIVRVKGIAGEGLLVEETGILEGLQEVGLPHEDVVAQAHPLGAVGRAVGFRRHQAVPLAGKSVVDHRRLVPWRQPDSERGAQGAAVVHVIGEGLAVEEGAVADDNRVLEQKRPAEGLDLVAGVALGKGAPDLDGRAGFGNVEEVETVGGVVANDRVFYDPVSAAGAGGEPIAVAAGGLRPAAGGLLAGVGLAAAVPLDRPAAEGQGAGVGIAMLVPQVAVPAGGAVAGDAHVLHRPVGEPAGVDADAGQAMDVQMVEVDVRRVFGVQASGGPRAVGRRVAFAGQAAGMEFDAAGVIGDLQVADLDVAGICQVDDKPGALRAPQFGWVLTIPQDAGGVGRAGTAGNGGHVAVESAAGVAVLRAGCAVPHHVRAAGDDQAVAAGDADERAAGGQGAEGVIPGAGPVHPAAGVGRVYPTCTLGCGAAVGADVIGDFLSLAQGNAQGVTAARRRREDEQAENQSPGPDGPLEHMPQLV